MKDSLNAATDTMSEKNQIISLKQKRKKRGKRKGRQVDPQSQNEVKSLISHLPLRRNLLIEYLHQIQDEFRAISARHITALADLLKISTSEVYEVATFYHHFDVVKDDSETPPLVTVRVCDSITCQMYKAETLIQRLTDKCGNGIRVQRVPCVGRCETAPVAVVGKNAICNATVGMVTQAISDHALEPQMPDYMDYETYRKENNGYQLLEDLIAGKRSKEEIISILEDSELRGLGGAGFPAGRKWRIVSEQSSPRMMAVNIDEGEPGTFKDRHYLETNPHQFFEGMLIAAYIVGVDQIYIYLRDEYAGIYNMLQKELQVLIDNIPTTPYLELRRAAGAYICGEESAMIESIEGKRGMPRLRPPFVAQVGLFGYPTLEHNMETLYWVKPIVEQGADWFTSHGRHGRKGLRSFSVSGRVKKPGVHLAPAGITVRELIDEYCGGMQDEHTFYGYFPGGASGGILPASMGDIPLDFDTLNEYGCFIGSAAVIILSDKDKARKMATNAMRFFEHESCGKCTPCRVGTSKAVKLMEKDKWDIPLMNELSQVMSDASICGLGQAAPNPLQSVIKYFPEELE